MESGPPDVPLDIVTLLLELLCDENATLKACAVVCRSWLAVTRPVLFRSLHITARRISIPKVHPNGVPQPYTDDYTRYLSGKDNQLFQEQLAELSSFLDNRPDICGMVKNITLRTVPEPDHPPCNMNLEEIVQVFNRFHSLHSVVFDTLRFSNLVRDPQVVCSSARTIALSDLKLGRFCQDPDLVSKIIAHFPNTQDMQIDHCADLNLWLARPVLNPVDAGVRLRSLSVTGSRPLTYWLNLATDTLCCLQNLQVSSLMFLLDEGEFLALRTILLRAAEQLSHLSLGLVVSADTPSPGQRSFCRKSC